MTIIKIILIILCAVFYASNSIASNLRWKYLFDQFVDKQRIANMSVGVNDGKKSYTLQYGSLTQYPINSMSKTFATLLTAYYCVDGKMQLEGQVSHYLPELKGTDIGVAKILNFATHTTGLPLSLSVVLDTPAKAYHYLTLWQPTYAIGSRREYSNLGIGVLGYALQNITGKAYADLVSARILLPFAMKHTTINPAKYHLLTGRDNVFIAADGMVSTASDMNRYLRHMMQVVPSSRVMNKAIHKVFSGYYTTPYFVSALGWRAYGWPISRSTYLSSSSMKSLNTPAKPFKHPSAQLQLFSKTGSGHGFTSIMGFIPSKKVSVVILIEKNISIKQRMSLLYDELSQLILADAVKVDSVSH